MTWIATSTPSQNICTMLMNLSTTPNRVRNPTKKLRKSLSKALEESSLGKIRLCIDLYAQSHVFYTRNIVFQNVIHHFEDGLPSHLNKKFTSQWILSLPSKLNHINLTFLKKKHELYKIINIFPIGPQLT